MKISHQWPTCLLLNTVWGLLWPAGELHVLTCRTGSMFALQKVEMPQSHRYQELCFAVSSLELNIRARSDRQYIFIHQRMRDIFPKMTACLHIWLNAFKWQKSARIMGARGQSAEATVAAARASGGEQKVAV